MFYVLLSWTDYHKLLAGSPNTDYYTKEQQAKRVARQQDEIIPVNSETIAKQLVSEFNKLCEADWTPNQSPQDREYYGLQARHANEIIQSAREGVDLAIKMNEEIKR